MNFDYVLAGVTARSAHDREQNFVQDIVRARRKNLPVIKFVRLKLPNLNFTCTNTSLAIRFRAGPLIRTMATPPSPGGVATAAIVSSLYIKSVKHPNKFKAEGK